MRCWQNDRNYWKQKNEDGFIACFIKVDGMNVEVGADIYKAYSRFDRMERYQAERDAGRFLSLDKMFENGSSAPYSAGRQAGTEDAVVENMLKPRLNQALKRLDGKELDLIRKLYFEGISIREYARRRELSEHAIRYRESRILRKMKKVLKK